MKRQRWSRLGIGMICAIAPIVAAAPLAQARQIIIRYPTREEHRYPVIYEQRQRRQHVTVEFIARGDEWANVYVDGRRIFSPSNANRRKRFTFRDGAYEIKITGVNYFDIWAEGYLDIGRDDANIIVVSFSESGVRVSGDPHTWIPISTESRSSRHH